MECECMSLYLHAGNVSARPTCKKAAKTDRQWLEMAQMGLVVIVHDLRFVGSINRSHLIIIYLLLKNKLM